MPGHHTSPPRGWSSVHAGEGAKSCPERGTQAGQTGGHRALGGAGRRLGPSLYLACPSRLRTPRDPASCPPLLQLLGWVSDTCTQSTLTRRGSAGVLTVRCTRIHAPPKTSPSCFTALPKPASGPNRSSSPGGARRPVLQVPAVPTQALPLPRSAQIRKEAAPSVSCPPAAPPRVGPGQAAPSGRYCVTNVSPFYG